MAIACARYEDIVEAEGQLQYLKVGDMASPSTSVFKISLNIKKWIRTKNLTKIFKTVTVLDNLNFEFDAGTLTARIVSAVAGMKKTFARRQLRNFQHG